MVVLKNKYIIIFITCLAIFFFFGAFKINAQEVVIIEKPIASDLIYGEPLFESVLSGGESSVEGVFSWKNERNTFSVGKHSETVIFTPNDSNYGSVEIEVDFIVNKRRVYIKFENEVRKLYDGNNSIILPNYIVGGIVDKTVYLKGTLSGSLNSVLIGENELILEGVELEGENKENYFLDLNGFTGSVYPKWVEKQIGVKNRVDLEDNYVPFDSDVYVDKVENSSIKKKNYKIKEVYNVYLKSG